ncbi:hypothetical protein [Paenibacillus agilis]|uniref:Uncharacterized protein n=1 Tax=Paenibacillus agilis TaxID=3020863 RepID=A0A559IDM8_9BACL|nr:hypothetical protein [Paenibacillus agilis]TVX85630.1 hypothetical protein FPZ44_25090 [Paenibacillus agilis]
MPKKRIGQVSVTDSTTKVKVGVLVELSPTAYTRFTEACQKYGGQTDFIQNSIEFYTAYSEDGYVKKRDVLLRLDQIENYLHLWSEKKVDYVERSTDFNSTEQYQQANEILPLENDNTSHVPKEVSVESQQRATLTAFLGNALNP